MRAVIQRVSEAGVVVNGEQVSAIGEGLLVLLGVCEGDTGQDLKWMVDKISGLRIFPDGEGKMNRSVLDQGGQILLVSQFTLAADVKKGRRPSFAKAMEPVKAREMCEEVTRGLGMAGLKVAGGVFGASMEVSLVNQGPVTIILDSRD